MAFIDVAPILRSHVWIILIANILLLFGVLGFEVYRFMHSKGILRVFIHSVSRFRSYPKFKNVRFPSLLVYLLVVSLVFVLGVSSYAGFYLASVLSEPFLLPEFSIQQGQVFSDVEQPYLLKSGDVPFFVLDTTGKATELSDDGGALLLKDRFQVVKKRNGVAIENREFVFPPDLNFEFNGAFVSSIASASVFFGALFFEVFFFVVLFLYFFVYTLIITVISLVTNAVLRTKLRFEHVYALSVVIYVPLAVVGSLVGFLFTLPTFVFSFIYLALVGVALKKASLR